jgi:hypothetical protein
MAVTFGGTAVVWFAVRQLMKPVSPHQIRSAMLILLIIVCGAQIRNASIIEANVLVTWNVHQSGLITIEVS